MDYFWKENKKYLIAVGAALLFVLVFHWFVLGPIRSRADLVAKKRGMEERSLRERVEKGVPDEDTIGVAKIEYKRTQDLLASLAGDMSFKVPDRYVRKPEGQGWVEHWNAEKLEVEREIQRKIKGLAGFPRQVVPSSGLEDLQEEAAREMLLRLAVVEKVVDMAVEAKVDKVDTIDMVPVTHAGARKDEAVTRKGVFLNKYMIRMTFKGDQQSVFKLLHGVQKKGSFLAVAHFEVDRKDPTKDYLDADIRVCLLGIDEKAPIELKEERAP